MHHQFNTHLIVINILSQFKFDNKLSSLFDDKKKKKKNQKTNNDIIRLENRGTLIDLSNSNADSVPLRLLRRMYPIVLWKSDIVVGMVLFHVIKY